MQKPATVDVYINSIPKPFQPRLQELREIITKTVPEAEEKISYGMPFYQYKGRLVYFALMKNYIGLYIPPPIIEQHKKELENYITTKSAIHIPLENGLPKKLIEILVLARKKWNEEQKKKWNRYL